MTRNGVEMNLSISPFIFETVNGYRFHFSSKYYLEKFISGYIENRNVMAEKLSKLFGFRVSATILSDITFYSKIEKRGFYIVQGVNVFKSIDTVYSIVGFVYKDVKGDNNGEDAPKNSMGHKNESETIS